MAELPPYEIREYRPGDEEAILATFNKVFAEIDPSFEPRTLEAWRWQYLENPSGWRIYLAVTQEDGRVISQYAGIRQRMRLQGEAAYFSQALDSMTDPAFRRGLKKPGFFVLTGYPYAANYGGPPPEGDVIMWGFPVPPAWRIGKTYLEYDMVRTQLELACPLERLQPGAAGSVAVEEASAIPEDAEALFERFAQGIGAIALRDRAQLEWRFLRSPVQRYRLGFARAGGELVGYAVYRTGAFDRRENRGLVCDWICDRERPEARAALLAWLGSRAREEGAEDLVAIFPDTAPEWMAFQQAGFRARTTRYFMVGRTYYKPITMRWLYRNWYYTLGDSDLVLGDPMAQDYEIRPFRDEDQASLLETFNLVFQAESPELPARTRAEWEWAYRQNPAGHRIFVAVHEGRVVAQYAGLPNRVLFAGEEHTFLDIVDSFVHPDHRRGLKRPGLFINTAQPFLEAYGRPDGDLAFYGWPIEKAWPINKRFLNYEQVRSENVLAREPGEGEHEPPAGVEEIERFDHQARWLYDRCVGEWGVSAIRDDAFLNWRYVDNPFHAYTAYGVRDGEGVLRGLAVLRGESSELPGMSLVVDWLVPPDEPEVGALLERAALAYARRSGARALASLQLEWSPWFTRFQESGWKVWPSEWIMVASLFDRRLNSIWLRDHWWYQMGDLDVV